MASSKEYLFFILEQLSDLDEISYDDQLLIKPVKAAQKYMSEAVLVSPYPGAKEMLLVDNLDSKDYLTTLFKAMFDELPAPKAKRKNK